MVGELEGFAEIAELGLQAAHFGDVGWWRRCGLCAGAREQAVNASDAAAGAEALLHGRPQLRAGGKLVVAGELADEKLDVLIADVRWVHGGMIARKRKSFRFRRGGNHGEAVRGACGESKCRKFKGLCRIDVPRSSSTEDGRPAIAWVGPLPSSFPGM